MRRIIITTTAALAALGATSCADDQAGKVAASAPATTSPSTTGVPATTAGATDLPWRGKGTLTLDRSTGQGTGSGTSTTCGDWTMTERFTFGSVQTPGEATITCADGGQIQARIDTTAVAGDTNAFTMTITGGTGLYGSATGTATGRVLEQSLSGSDPATAVVTASVQFSGTIRVAGHGA